MLASPFTFYRGAALIMAADLAATPVSGVTVQVCGDAHLSNFGLFGTPEQNERDYAAFAAAADSGRLAARTGV
jgi:uncharacterized protein (DUF2252 family)